MGKFQDLTGKRFGKLTVLKRSENMGQKVAWHCKCDCGEEKVVRAYHLTDGLTVSCGCYRKEEMFLNEYEINGDTVTGYTNKGVKFIFDADDFKRVSKETWYENAEGYITTNIGNDKTISLQRFIMNPPKRMQVDHINRDIKYNKKSNLRICTNSDNAKNRGIYESNKSGFTGVWYDKKYNKWISYITVDNKRMYLGRFSNFDEAVLVRKNAEKEFKIGDGFRI